MNDAMNKMLSPNDARRAMLIAARAKGLSVPATSRAIRAAVLKTASLDAFEAGDDATFLDLVRTALEG